MTVVHTVPFTVTDTELTSTDVPEPNTDEWSSTTAYVTDDEVDVLGTIHKRYRAVAGSTNEYPPDDTTNTYWVEIASTNRWKPFDNYINDPMIQATTANYTLVFATKSPQVVACLGLSADTVRLQITTTDEITVFDETVNLNDNSHIVDHYEYCFAPIIKRDLVAFTEIPQHYGASVDLTFTIASGSNVEVGQIVVGDKFNLGYAQYGSSISIRDYSRKEQNAFGQFDITQRDYSDEVDFVIRYDTIVSRVIKKRLADNRASPTLWVGQPDVDYGLVAYGFYENFELTLETVKFSEATISVVGLT